MIDLFLPVLKVFSCGQLSSQAAIAFRGGSFFTKHHVLVNLLGLCVCGITRILLILLEASTFNESIDRNARIGHSTINNLLVTGLSLASHEVRARKREHNVNIVPADYKSKGYDKKIDSLFHHIEYLY